jgi:hypothetical protein
VVLQLRADRASVLPHETLAERVLALLSESFALEHVPLAETSLAKSADPVESWTSLRYCRAQADVHAIGAIGDIGGELIFRPIGFISLIRM